MNLISCLVFMDSLFRRIYCWIWLLAENSYYFLFRPTTLGVKVLVTNEVGDVLLVKHSYRLGWHLPGGGVKRGEMPLIAAVREVREETGIACRPENLVLNGVYLNKTNFRNDYIFLFSTGLFTEEPGFRSNNLEILEACFFPRLNLPSSTTTATLERIKDILEPLAFKNW